MEPTDDDDGNICRDYARGLCSRGDKCKFKHPAAKRAYTTDDPSVCRDYLNGKCHRNSCKFSHPPLPDSDPATQMNAGEMRTMAPPDAPVCKDFLNGVCMRRSNCRFRHAFQDMPPLPPPHPSMPPAAFRHMPPPPPPPRNHSEGPPIPPPLKRPREMPEDDDLPAENEMLRRRISDLQREIVDLRTMNDTLYEQNKMYRQQICKLEPSAVARTTVAYPSPSSYPSYSTGSYGSYNVPPPASGLGGGSTRDYGGSPAASMRGPSGYDGYSKF